MPVFKGFKKCESPPEAQYKKLSSGSQYITDRVSPRLTKSFFLFFSLDFPDWREDVLYGFMQFVVKDIIDGQTTLLDNALRMLCQLLTTWKNNADKVKKFFVKLINIFVYNICLQYLFTFILDTKQTNQYFGSHQTWPQ